MADQVVTLDPNETIIRIIRKHPINLLPVFIAAALVLLATVLGSGWLTLHQAEISKYVPISVPSITGVLMLLDVLMLLIVGLAILIFRQNRIILTSKHLVQVKQNGLLDRSLSKFTLDELQDVKGSRTGLFATVLNYGDLMIETAGAKENFIFGPVADPLSTAELINDSHEQFESDHIYERP